MGLQHAGNALGNLRPQDYREVNIPLANSLANDTTGPLKKTRPNAWNMVNPPKGAEGRHLPLGTSIRHGARGSWHFGQLELLAGGELEFVLAKRVSTGGAHGKAVAAADPPVSYPLVLPGLCTFRQGNAAVRCEDVEASRVEEVRQGTKAMDFCYELEHQMRQVGVDILTMNTEYGEGQLEITFAPRFGIEAVDQMATFRLGTKDGEIAQAADLRATFMVPGTQIAEDLLTGRNFSIWSPTQTPRTDEGASSLLGSGLGHPAYAESHSTIGFSFEDPPSRLQTSTMTCCMTTVTLCPGKDGMFPKAALDTSGGMLLDVNWTRAWCSEDLDHARADADGLSDSAKSFLAGVLAHAPALEALCSPTPPCYCRHGNWAPTVANWGFDDRTACVRVKSDKKGPPGSCYMELRMPSSSANPYLVIAGLVASGLDGLQRKLELPPQRQSEAFSVSWWIQ
ncbi:Glutamine synthetase (GS) (Glutamate--ammonia ligase) (Glutamine synthetase I alpha) (GSI alpha) [Durusdinium trenchii]|uniref:Lengsin n=1 Tax=Durusdinium trenchii TaxID=1381693 RepID=A0ABP0Q8V2_9DINO